MSSVIEPFAVAGNFEVTKEIGQGYDSAWTAKPNDREVGQEVVYKIVVKNKYNAPVNTIVFKENFPEHLLLTFVA